MKGKRAFSSQAPLVDVSVDGSSGIATLTLQRAPVNSLNLDLCKTLLAAIQDVEKNKSRGIILTSVIFLLLKTKCCYKAFTGTTYSFQRWIGYHGNVSTGPSAFE